MSPHFKISLALLVLIVLGCAAWQFIAFVQYESLYVQGEARRNMGLSDPPDCGHLYNVDRHAEWADCMGVGYK